MSGQQTLALVGAVGGAGTTRLAVESGAILARTGRDVAVVDAGFATQGLANYVEGPIETDVTAVVTQDGELEAALYPITTGLAGALDAAPVHAPFERLARAKTAGAAERFERQLAAAALSYDVVVVDTPPIAANQAVAAVNASERVAVATPDTARGADGLARTRARLQDVGAGLDTVVATFTDEPTVVEDAAVAVPTHETTRAADCPVAPDDEVLGPAVAAFVETVLDVDLGLTFEEPGRLDRFLPGNH